MIVYLDRQHAGQIHRIHSRGAEAKPTPAFGNGMEAIYTGYLSIMIEEKLLEHGVKVMPIADGKYSERHNRVNEYSKKFPQDKQVYLALHLNAGGGDYASFFHMGSNGGATLASSICDKLKEASLPGLVRCLPKKAAPNDWTKNAHYTIKGVKTPIALCCEPLFMDTHPHLLTFEHLKTIGGAIASGIVAWSL